MQQKNDAIEGSAVSTDRKVWIMPHVAKIGAGEAEVGANPVIAEGFFGKGS